ncbi:MAG: hypothetical protein PHE51_03565 [Eubacteriales bacterium]|nr:hypothetical protein [Eubacteriales bacterium]
MLLENLILTTIGCLFCTVCTNWGSSSDETAFLGYITVIKSSLINTDGKTILDTPKSLDRFSSAVIKRSTADFNNTEDEIWGYKGYDGNMKNWDVQKLLRDNSSTDRYYHTSFTETGTYGTMKSAHFNLPLGQGSMWDLSNFKYVTMSIRSNTNVAVRLYQNGPSARETSSGPTIPNTNGKWETVTIPIEDFLSSWLYNDFTRNSSRVNYVIFYPSFTEGGNTDRYFDVDNISFNWTNSKVGITKIDFTDSTGASINSKGLSAGKVKATITVSNTKDIDAGNEAANVLAIFALYDKTTGDLAEVKASSKSIESNKTVSIYDTINVPENAYDRYELKIHLWDYETLTPITESYIFY